VAAVVAAVCGSWDRRSDTVVGISTTTCRIAKLLLSPPLSEQRYSVARRHAVCVSAEPRLHAEFSGGLAIRLTRLQPTNVRGSGFFNILRRVTQLERMHTLWSINSPEN